MWAHPDHYVKVDISDDTEYRVVGSATSNVEHHDEDFAVALGNLVVLGDDKYNGSFIFPHQAEPDTAGPAVNMVVPINGAVGRSRRSRIGLTFTDQIDLRTVHAASLIVRPLDGTPISGQYSLQTGIVNFSPDVPLEPNTVYEVVVPSGGITDVSGNTTIREFRTTFTTGEYAGNSLLCEVKPVDAAAVGQAVEFTANLIVGSGDVTYLWDFGDGSPTVGPASTQRISHPYSQPGHYTVHLTVYDGPYSTSCAALATVHRRTQAGHAPSASTIILDRSGTQVWTVNPDNNTVTAIDAVLLTRMFEQPVGRHPRTLAQAPDSTIWVVNQYDATISVLDSSSGGLLHTIDLPLGSQPFAIIFSPDQQAAYVSLQAVGRVAKLDPQSSRNRGRTRGRTYTPWSCHDP